MQTMNVYFNIPDKRSVVLLEVDVKNYSAEAMQANVSQMMGAEAEAVDAGAYRRLKKKYEG